MVGLDYYAVPCKYGTLYNLFNYIDPLYKNLKGSRSVDSGPNTLRVRCPLPPAAKTPPKGGVLLS